MFWILFFFFAGCALILAEFILPGLVCGVLGVIFLVVSSTIATYSHPELAVFVVLGEGLAALACIGFGFYALPRTRFGRAMILDSSQQSNDGWVSDASDHSLLGALGEAFTPLRPAGTVTINGRRLGAVSTGDFIDTGAAVRVVEVHGNRVVVERAEAH